MEPPLNKLNIREFRGEDRISQLPDPILHSILSRLSTRNALPTMLLSKRWKELWATMPYFYISEYNHSAEAVSNYVRFVDSLLLLCDQSDIQSFWLGFGPLRKWPYGGLKQQHLNRWIGHLVRRNVKRLGVEALLGEAVTLPSCLFSCPSLQDLKLACWEFVKLTVPEFHGLGRLTKLCVRHIIFDCESLKKIISGCPVLEDLNITRCVLDCLDISSDSLETLSIRQCVITGSIIRISSPRLQQLCFRLNKVNSLEVCLGNLSSLVDASVQVDNFSFLGEEVFKPLKFVTSWNKNSSGDSALSTFSNLKKLIIGVRIVNQSFPAVVYFLDRSPNLEQLCLFGYGCGEFEGKQASYTCAHIKRKIVFHCGLENDSLIEKMEKYLQSKCYCHSKLIVDTSRVDRLQHLLTP